VARSKTKVKKVAPRKWHVVGYSLLIVVFAFFQYSEGIRYYVQAVWNHICPKEDTRDVTVHDIRSVEILDKHDDMLFGFDVSHYQYQVDWKAIDSIYLKYPLDLVFIRSTMGIDGVDKTFGTNWRLSKSRLLVRGAYHYYRPDEN